MNLSFELRSEYSKYVTRRWFLRQCGVGLGSIALASLLDPGKVFGGEKMAAASNPLAPSQPHFKPTAERVIHLFMGGAPSQLDLFDYTPSLAKYNGRPVPTDAVMAQQRGYVKPVP